MAKVATPHKPLIVVDRNLKQHFARMQKLFRDATEAVGDLRLDPVWNQEIVTANLAGAACEVVQRNRGGRSHVVPLLQLSAQLYAWLGYNEEWASAKPVGGSKSFSFRSVSLTVHFGSRNDVIKPQIFRAEWAGYAPWERGALGFQGKNAGHPHWQFDVMESMLTEKQDEDAKELLELLQEDAVPAAKEFNPPPDTEFIIDIIRAQKLSKIHFASAASWWLKPPLDGHTHTPSDTLEISTWTERTLSYTYQELKRLESGL